jgi:hypothetical protein
MVGELIFTQMADVHTMFGLVCFDDFEASHIYVDAVPGR